MGHWPQSSEWKGLLESHAVAWEGCAAERRNQVYYKPRAVDLRRHVPTVYKATQPGV